MTVHKCPITVAILAWIYIATGAIGSVYNFRELSLRHQVNYDAALVELTEMLAIACGAFMLKGHNWARWLAVAWMAFHVVISTFHTFREAAIHFLFLGVIGWLLFRHPADLFFTGRTEPT